MYLIYLNHERGIVKHEHDNKRNQRVFRKKVRERKTKQTQCKKQRRFIMVRSTNYGTNRHNQRNKIIK